jgi:hypothetical protein
VAVGGLDGDAAVWLSENGVEWVRVEHEELLSARDEGVSEAYSVAPGGPGLVAAGSVGFIDTGSDGVIWTSADGIEWQRITIPQESAFESVHRDPGSGRLLVFGRSSIWSSMDGLAWDEVSLGGGIWAGAPGSASGVAWFEDSLVAGGYDSATSLWLSEDDGLSWLRLARDDPAFDGSPIMDVTAFDSKIVAVGDGVWIGEFTG